MFLWEENSLSQRQDGKLKKFAHHDTETKKLCCCQLSSVCSFSSSQNSSDSNSVFATARLLENTGDDEIR